jgi:hypothetical protein
MKLDSDTHRVIAWILFIPMLIVSLLLLLPSILVYIVTLSWAKKSHSNVSEESNPENDTVSGGANTTRS